ncbi:hypothetical protein D3C78_1721750 [compost metagenome]
MGAGDGGVGHPDVLVGPPLLRRAGLEGAAEQRPLDTPVAALLVHQVGGDVPPLDTEIRMRAVVGREDYRPARHDPGEVRHLPAEFGVALPGWRLGVAGGDQQGAGQHEPSVHR